MLDDLKLIHERDSRDMLGTAGKQWQWLEYWRSRPDGLRVPPRPQAIAAYAEGGALAALRMVCSWSGLTVPLEVRTAPELARYAGLEVLQVIADYDGKGPGRQLLRQAADGSGAGTVVVMTADKELQDEARRAGAVVWELPGGILEQQSIIMVATALQELFFRLGCLPAEQPDPAVIGEEFRQALEGWPPTVPTVRNRAKQLALELAGKSVVVTGGPLLAPAAGAWKTYLNRNARHVAWAGSYPSSERDELEGWSRQPVIKPYAVVSLEGSLEDDAARQRAALSRRLLSGVRPEPAVIDAMGGTVSGQSLYAAGLGEYVSLYLALLAGLDPAVSDKIAKFDKELLQ